MLKTRKKCLILTAPIGAGHRQVAQSLALAAGLRFPELSVEVVDIFDLFPKRLVHLFLRIYELILIKNPAIYRSIYGLGNHSYGASLFSRGWNKLLASLWCNQYKSKLNADFIICTHASAAGLVSELKKKKLISAPVLGVITDFVVHRLWFYQNIDGYTVATTKMREQLQGWGYGGKIYECGIPLRSDFYQFNKNSVSNQKQQDRFTILLMGGGLGLLPMESIIEALLKVKLPIQIIAITGKNQALYDRLQYFYKDTHQVVIKGYCHDMVQNMMNADLLVTKCGGVSVMEAIQLHLPMIVYSPLPGQEEGNTAFLLEHHLAKVAYDISELADLVSLEVQGYYKKDIQDSVDSVDGFASGLHTVLKWLEQNLECIRIK